jgi:coproporphyrinogen III oxidase
MIVTEKYWFGGGMDLTPTIEFEDDTEYFHAMLCDMCTRHDPKYYQDFKRECDEYFFIKHRNQARGVGGIFYDYLSTQNWEKDFAFNKDVGMAFLDIFPQLVRKRYEISWGDEEKAAQLAKRALYAEFNLVYDRGTKFGLITGGNPEAILMSLPPLCAWK